MSEDKNPKKEYQPIVTTSKEEEQISERGLQSAWNAFFDLLLNKKDGEKKDQVR
jgi:hypothetical protein